MIVHLTTRDEGNENKACARAMMCWTASKLEGCEWKVRELNKPKDASN